MTKKVIEGGVVVEAYALDFEMAQRQIGSKSRSRVTTPKWLIFSDQNLMHMLHVTTPPSMTF